MAQRLFLGIRPVGAILEESLAVQQDFRRALERSGKGRGLRWTAPENLHLTVHFLGDTDEPRRLALVEALRSLPLPPAHRQPLPEWLGFPSLRKARVLGLGAPSAEALFRDLHRRTARLLESLGFALESREFIPHLTLARLRFPQDLSPWSAPPQAPLLAFPVQALTLYRSRPGPEGSRYEILEEYPLAPAP